MNIIEYWAVEEHYDMSVTPIGNFASSEAADAVVGKSHYRTAYKKTLIIYDTAEDFNENNPNEIRKKALAKLTTAEKIALGLERI